jgi:hypothetical protein
MKINTRSLLGLCAALGMILLCFGCQNPGIVQLSPNTYMLSRDDHAGVFGNFGALKAGVIRDADAFAESKGKVAVPITSKEHPVGVLGNWASFEYQFMLLDKNDPRASGVSLAPRPDLVIEKTDNINANVHTKDDTEKSPDLYTELTKLDDLRKKGIITDAEFDAQKQKLLNESK